MIQLQGENRDKASERTGREGVRGGSSRGDHQTDFSCLRSSKDLSNPLTDLNRQREAKWYTSYFLTSENRVHWYHAVLKLKLFFSLAIYQPVGILSIPSSPTVVIRCFLNGFVDIFFSFDDLEPDWLHLHAGTRSLTSSIGTVRF